VSDQWR
jgi:hypothetical protein